MTSKLIDTPAKDFLIERYKYILGQKKDLNERSFKIASVFQALLLLVASGQYKVVLDLEGGSIGADRGILVSWAMFAFVCIATACYLSLLLGGLFAWIKYRGDEATIEADVFGAARSPPRVKDCLRWYETYLIVAGLAAPLVHFIFLRYLVCTFALG